MSNPSTFAAWKLRHGPTSTEDTDGKARALIEMGWNGAVEEVVKWLHERSQSGNDRQWAYLGSAAENIDLVMRSPRVCSCCQQLLPEEGAC